MLATHWFWISHNPFVCESSTQRGSSPNTPRGNKLITRGSSTKDNFSQTTRPQRITRPSLWQTYVGPASRQLSSEYLSKKHSGYKSNDSQDQSTSRSLSQPSTTRNTAATFPWAACGCSTRAGTRTRRLQGGYSARKIIEIRRQIRQTRIQPCHHLRQLPDLIRYIAAGNEVLRQSRHVCTQSSQVGFKLIHMTRDAVDGRGISQCLSQISDVYPGIWQADLICGVIRHRYNVTRCLHCTERSPNAISIPYGESELHEDRDKCYEDEKRRHMVPSNPRRRFSLFIVPIWRAVMLLVR